MVACYAIGFGAGKNWAARVEAATGVKFANDTTSTGVYISYNTEGPGGTGQSKLWPADAVAVNPLTWTQNGVAAPETNTGAKLSVMEEEAYPGMYGAEISDHGTVVCRQIDSGKYADSSTGFGDRCLHAWDYAAYWNNIAGNGMQRAAQLAGWKSVKVTGLEDHTYIAQYMYKIGFMLYEAVRAGDTYWIPESATWAQVVVNAADGYKLASGKTNDKVNITVTEAMQEVVLDVTGKTAVWDSQRKPDYLTAHDWVVNHALKPTEAKQIAKEPDNDTGVDVFFVYPTIADTASATTVNGFVDLDDPQMRGDEMARTDGVWWEFAHQACAFNGFGNFYMPYYRQMNLANALAIADGAADYTEANKAFADSIYAGVAYADVTAALDVYFKYWNNGRKFILAAHSQGSAILRDVMEHYFTQDEAHKALLKNLVCSYQIGYGVGSSWLADLAQNTQSANGLANGVKFASDATGTGCIVSWNLTGADATGKSLLLPADAVSINPLTWSLGGDMAGKSLNLGTAFKLNPDSIVPGKVSAQVNLTRGTVECSEMSDKYLNIPQFGDKSLHLNDYGAYWVNLRQNINERIHTATGKYPIDPIEFEPASSSITVRLKASSLPAGWGDVAIYYWGSENSGWPGEKLTEKDGWYTKTFKETITSVSILWNNNNNGMQTVNIENVNASTCYEITGGSGTKHTIRTVEYQIQAPVPYVAADGTIDTCKTYTLVEDSSAQVTWNAGWYVVKGSDVKLDQGAKCNGAVHLILADSAKLTAMTGIIVQGNNNSFAVYGQVGQTGKLIAVGGTGCAGIGSISDTGKNITINGGDITATGGGNSAGIGGGYDCAGSNIIINGGKVTATGTGGAGIGGGAYKAGSYITINGGEVEACSVPVPGANGVGDAIGSGKSGGAAINVFVDPSLVLKAENTNPPTTVIAHASITTDVASQLGGKQYATVTPPQGPDMHDMLYFVGLNGNDTVRLNKRVSDANDLAKLTATFEYSKDRINWTEYTWNGEQGDPIALPNAGDTVFFRAKGTNGKNALLSLNPSAFFQFVFGQNDSIEAGGNIMSLYDATLEQDTMTKYGFVSLFNNAAQMVSAPELPATKMDTACYQGMFYMCTSLKAAPALPASKLSYGCYNSMFWLCTSLTQAPELNATDLADGCYQSMFWNCSSLTVAPALPATELAASCYYYMFRNCSSLIQVPKLNATEMVQNCYSGMFQDCTSLIVDTCGVSGSGIDLEIPKQDPEPRYWNRDMFKGCRGAYTNVRQGGHYFIKGFVPDTIHGIELVAVDTVFDKHNHSITVNGTIEGDVVTYSTDSTTWGQNPQFWKAVQDTTVYVRIQRTDHYDWHGKSTVTIAPKQLTVDSTTVADKIYDGNTDATVTAGTLVGVVAGDTVKLSASGSFDNKNAGEDKDVSVCYSIIGEDTITANYLTPGNGTLKATITPTTLTVSGTTVDDKVYDGTTNAVVSASGALEGVVGSDDVNIESATGTFADKNVDKDIEVTVSYNLSGADKDNYTVEDGRSSADITQREITLQSAVVEKKYDGTVLTAYSEQSGTVITDVNTGYVDGECFSYSFTGSQTDVGYCDNTFEYSGNDSTNVDNYNVTQMYGTLTVIPTDTLITITADSKTKVYDGTPLTKNGYTVSGILGAGNYVADVTIEGTITKVGTEPNEVTGYKIYNMMGDEVTSFYTNVQTADGTLTVISPVEASIIGMYDKWNIVLDKKAFEDSLAVYGVTAQINPDSVRWYVVVTDADTVGMLDGSVTDDTLATRSTGLFHTEDKAMDAQYYAVICVPEAQAVLGVRYFQSNVVFMAAPTAPMRDMQEGADSSKKPVKVVVDGQFMIIDGERHYNANGVEL